MSQARVSFTCPRCAATSHHPEDVGQGYCGVCHDWTGGRQPPGDVMCPECGQMHEATTFRVFGCARNWPWL